jgi:hypothetical protein
MSEQTEIKELLQELVEEKRQEPVAVKHDLIDNLSKIGVALCTAAVLYVATQLQGLTTDVAVMKNEMGVVSKFMETPRFDKNDNAAADQVLLNEIKDIVEDLADEVSNNRHDIQVLKSGTKEDKDLLEEVEDRLQELEMKTTRK